MKQLALAFLSFVIIADSAAAEKILFVRGGEGTVGFFEGGSDEQGADIFNYATNGGNHGWGELHAALVAEGFTPEQVAENPVAGGVPTPIPLDTLDLSQYAVIVFGSNNAEYTTAQVDALLAYITAGGAALFISDANFGQNWGDAPSSDQAFLTRFGLTMNQDQGTYAIRRANEFLVPSHPILIGVDSFDGEGVSPITRGASPAGITSTILTEARNSVRRNTGSAQGPSESVTANDASLVVATVGVGRIAGHYDRNTFFNDNGAGTNINRLDNEIYARNLFNWLAGNSTTTSNYAPRGHFPDLISGSSLPEGTTFTTEVIAKDPDGSIAYVDLKVDGTLVERDSTAPFQWQVPPLSAGSRLLTATVVDSGGEMTDVDVELQVVDGADFEQPIDRSGWTLSANRSSDELGNAIDGNIGTRWPTRQFQQAGQIFGIDFGQREIFQRIVLETPANPEDYPRGYVVRGSDDGSNFTVLATGAGDGATTDIFLPAPVTYRHVEIEQTGASSNRWWSIHEINVLQPPANSVLPLDSWLQFYYADMPASLLEDGDCDGMTTLEEYAYNSNPLAHSAASGPVAEVGAGFVDYTFRRWRDIASADVSYVIETSSDLILWESAGANMQFIGTPIQNRDGTETVTARITFGTTERRQFVRLKLVLK